MKKELKDSCITAVQCILFVLVLLAGTWLCSCNTQKDIVVDSGVYEFEWDRVVEVDMDRNVLYYQVSRRKVIEVDCSGVLLEELETGEEAAYIDEGRLLYD